MKSEPFLIYDEYIKKYPDILSKSILGKQHAYERYIKNSSLYKEYINLYKKVLISLRNLIGFINVKDSFDLGVLYTYFLLPNGILGLSDKFTYLKEKYDNIEIPDTLGGKVCSGTGVCRHVAKNFIDISNICGREAYVLFVKCVDKDVSHALIGLNIVNQKLVLDPTNQEIGFFDGKYIVCVDPFRIKTPRIYDYMGYNSKEIQRKQNKNNYLNVDKFYKLDSIQEVYDFFDRYDRVRDKYIKFEDYFLSFKDSNFGRYQKISLILENIVGYEYIDETKKLIKEK